VKAIQTSEMIHFQIHRCFIVSVDNMQPIAFAFKAELVLFGLFAKLMPQTDKD